MCDRKPRWQCKIPGNGCLWQGGICQPTLLTRILDKVPEALATLPLEIKEVDENKQFTVHLNEHGSNCHVRLVITCPSCKNETCPSCKNETLERQVSRDAIAVREAIKGMLRKSWSWKHIALGIVATAATAGIVGKTLNRTLGNTGVTSLHAFTASTVPTAPTVQEEISDVEDSIPITPHAHVYFVNEYLTLRKQEKYIRDDEDRFLKIFLLSQGNWMKLSNGDLQSTKRKTKRTKRIIEEIQRKWAEFVIWITNNPDEDISAFIYRET